MRNYSFPLTFVILLTIIFVSACSQPPTVASQTATPFATSTPSMTITPSQTTTATYVPITPAFSGTQVPNTSAVISVENADRLTLFARWGNGNVFDAQYTPNGEYLVVAYSTGVYFYSAKDYSFVKYIDLGTAISHIAFTRDEQKMAVASLGNVFIFNQGESEPTVTINESAFSLAFSPDGQILAIGAHDWPNDSGVRTEAIKLFDANTGKLITVFQDSEVAHTLAFSPDGTLLAAGSNATQIWSLDGKLLDTHGPYVSGGGTRSLSFSANGQLLAEGAITNNILQVWQVLNNGKLEIFRTISLDNYPSVYDVFEVAISPDGDFLAAATDNGLFIWQLSSGVLIYHKNDSYENYNRVFYFGVSWSPNSKKLASISDQDGLEIWNISNGRLELLYSPDNLTGAFTAMAWQPNGDTLASAADNGKVFLVESQNGNLSKVYKGDAIGKDFALSPDGRWLAIESSLWTEDQGVVIKDLTDDSFNQVLEGSYGAGLSSESFSRDGKYLVTSGFDGRKRMIQVWNTSDWSLYRAWDRYYDLVGQLIFCPDGETIALVESRSSTIKFYKIADDDLTLTTEMELSAPVGEARVNAIAFSPDGQKLLSFSRECESSKDCRKVLRMWQAGTENLIYMIKEDQERQIIPPSPPYYSDISSSIAWSPNGEIFAVGFSDGIVSVFKASNGELLEILSGHTMMVMGVSFSLDGQMLASASLDGTIRLWGIK